MTTAWWRSDAVDWHGPHGSRWSIAVRGDELADIRWNGRVLLRAVRAVVRDHGWNTVPVAVEGSHESVDGFDLRLRHDGLGAAFGSVLRVRARSAEPHDGGTQELVIEWDAVCERPFDTCRAGLVVLHPPSDAGRPVTVTHPDGRIERDALPTDISPHQPIMDIRELRIGEQGDAVTVRFDGDVFEMEDQRNWTDASFKTYSRPLALPFPYRLTAGERLRQSVTVSAPAVTATASTAISPAPTTTTLWLTPGRRFPAVGVEASTAPDPVPVSDVGAFRVVELDVTTPNWRAALGRAVRDGLPLDVRLVTDGDLPALHSVAAALRPLSVIAVTPFDSALHVSDDHTVAATRAALTEAGLDVPIRGGARSHFTEFNREHHRIPGDVAGVAVTVTPLFHSTDTEQLVESVAMQRLVAEQTVRMADGRPVHIGPVSLRPRFNNVATVPEPAPTRNDLAEGYGAAFTGGDDPRQDAPELGAWTIASAAALAVPGVASLSWFETVGPRGILDDTGAPRPVAAAVDALAPLADRTLLSGDSPDGLIWAIGARGEDDDIVLVANLDRQDRDVVVRVPGADRPVACTVPAGGWMRTRVGRLARD